MTEIDFDARLIRQQAIYNLRNQVAANGIIPIVEGTRRKAIDSLNDATVRVHDSRLLLQMADWARYFRVIIWGSARFGEETKEYKFIQDLSRSIIKNIDAGIITGGGPGLMEAANRGASEASIEASQNGDRISTIASHGVLITTLPNGEAPNSHLQVTSEHPEFTDRLQRFIDQSHGCFAGPGGYGSGLELLYALQLKQVVHLEEEYPLIAHPFWEKSIRAMQESMFYDRLETNELTLISNGDLNLIEFSDDIPTITARFMERYNQWAREFHQFVSIIPNGN